MDNEEKLLRMKKQVQKEKIDINRVEGALEQLYSTLDNDFGCKTKEEAVAKLKKTDILLSKKEKTFKEGMDKLRDDYDWDF